MKKLWITLMVFLMILAVPVTVAAQESTGCTITADAVTAVSGTTITIPVKINANPGFTNFALTIQYDAAALKLEKIDTVGSQEEAYICPRTASVNLDYVEQEGDEPCGYVNAAAEENITEDGILLAVTFTVLQETAGEIPVNLELKYLRSADVLTSAFTVLTASCEDAVITVAVKGDVTADGQITEEDAAFVYRHINEAVGLTEAQRISADVNNDDMVDTTDAALIYRVVHGTLSDFSGTEMEALTE